MFATLPDAVLKRLGPAPRDLHSGILVWSTISECGEWGGAESRGNGARPVE